MKTEEKFMMVFRYTPNPNHRPTEQEINEMSQNWGQFIGNLAVKEKLVSTEQLGFESAQILSDSSVIKEMYTEEGKIVSGNMIVKANSLEAAIALGKACPILKMGGSVEVRKITPMSI